VTQPKSSVLGLGSLEQYLSKFPLKQLTKDQLLFEIDQKLDTLFYLMSGYVRQYSITPEGSELTLNIFKPGSIFPLHLALTHLANPYYFEAMQRVEFTVVPMTEMSQYLQQNPLLLFDLTTRLASGLNQLSFRFESMVTGTAQQKLVAALYLLAKRFGQLFSSLEAKQQQELSKKFGIARQQFGPEVMVITSLSITHQLLATLTALTRETVSVEMMSLKKLGLIEYQRQQICLFQPKKLRELSSLPFSY
jgi:CRP-like cAMP-binding protein